MDPGDSHEDFFPGVGYLTGPFFLLMALIALSYGLGMLHLGGSGWNLLGLMTLIGAIALWCLPEMLLGRYRKQN